MLRGVAWVTEVLIDSGTMKNPTRDVQSSHHTQPPGEAVETPETQESRVCSPWTGTELGVSQE